MTPARRVVVLGASAGGLEAVRQLAAALPGDFNAAVVVVVHMAPESPGVMGPLVDRAGPLTAVQAENGMPIHVGRIYLPAPDHHLLVEPGRLRLSRGPRENRFRPAIDPLFRSAAQVYGPAAVGIILTGNLDDGTAGLYSVRQMGGVTVVQDPDDALFAAMPSSAHQHVKPDFCVPLSEMAPLLVRIVDTPLHAAPRPEASELLDLEVGIAKEQNAMAAVTTRFGEPSPYACPECHGVLWQREEAGRNRYRCHTGHAYSIDSLLASIQERAEEAMWNAVRALNEAGVLARGLARQSSDRDTAGTLEDRAAFAERQAATIRAMLVERDEARATEADR